MLKIARSTIFNTPSLLIGKIRDPLDPIVNLLIEMNHSRRQCASCAWKLRIIMFVCLNNAWSRLTRNIAGPPKTTSLGV